MRNLLLFFHLAAAIFWMGGMAFMVLALRVPVSEQLQPPVRLPMLAAVLRRFFSVVAISIVVLLATGVPLLLAAGGKPPPGWHAMAGLGIAMVLVFGHIFFAPWRRMKAAVAAADWPEAGRRMGQITLLAKLNLGLGWLAIAAVLLWR
ncbi:CopD family protein [uncultured Ramlibacter sp.]|uniref:CopD family protein n=1 Tax=uncultured Ramlibacter sp. TaxID=260755 RepID=UPI00260DC09C|nr:CopD family protein [uncultured Ramlibacter sp.]